MITYKNDNVFWIVIVGIAMALIAILAQGCAPLKGGNSAYSPIPMTASAVDKASAHVSSADDLVKQAKPSADKTGAALLDAASGEHGKAQAALSDAKTELAKAGDEKAKLQKQASDEATALAKVEGGWGYKLQVLVARLFVLVCVLVGLHLALLAATLFLPPPYSTLCGVAGKIINPLGWCVAIVDHLHLNRCQDLLPVSPARVINDGVKTA